MSNNFILDSSIAADLVLFASTRQRFLEEVIAGGVCDVHAPVHIDVEVVAVIRKYLLLNRISETEAMAMVSAHLTTPMTRYEPGFLLNRVLALRDNFSAYDACYVALTEAIDGTLVTRDAPLARAASRHCDVVLM